MPPASEALFPSGFRRLKKYVYPYIESQNDIIQGRYPYPDGYETAQTLSAAGGGEGGNPSLWDVHATVRVALKNTGQVRGKEVVQIYVFFPTNEPFLPSPESASRGNATLVDFPVKVLRGFHKIDLAPGETKEMSFSLTRRDLSYWNVEHANWIMPVQGPFTFRVGTSSRKLPLDAQW